MPLICDFNCNKLWERERVISENGIKCGRLSYDM